MPPYLTPRSPETQRFRIVSQDGEREVEGFEPARTLAQELAGQSA